MYTKALLLAALVAITEARFGQEQVPIAAIGAVTSGGKSGEAATLAGGSIAKLLAAANPCDKLIQADLIVATLGTGADSIAAAKGLVAAEQNFNPFVVNIPSICSDPTLPTTEALRGVVPLIDPAVAGSDTENANSKTSLTTPFANAGMSVADIMAANGFSNFTTKDASGAAGAAPAGGSASVAPEASAAPSASASAAPVASSVVAAPACGTTLVTVTRGAAAPTSTAAASPVASEAPAASSAAPATGGSDNGAAGVDPGFQASSIAGLDFGTCTPTIKFEAGLNGRKDTEFTFQAIDPVVNKGQQEALNPNIITNRICDQLTNVCGANDAAKTACQAAKAQISALGTRNAATADAWNTALGFAGTNTNPDGAPKAGLVGHT